MLQLQPLSDLLESSNTSTLRNEIKIREEFISSITDARHIAEIYDEVSRLRTRLYHVIKSHTRGRVHYTIVPILK